MSRWRSKHFACIAFCFLGLKTNADAEDQTTQPLRWAGKGPISETRVIEVDCGDAQYVLSITKERRKRPKLTKFERTPTQFSVDVREQFSRLISDYFLINNVVLSCGMGPADIADESTLAPSREGDFAEQLQVSLFGIHSIDTHNSQQECEAKNGEFDDETWRVARLSPDSIEISHNMIGTCYL